MKASLKWLNKYVDLDGVSVDEIAEALPMLGLEVEGIETTGLKPLDKVVVGEILSREPHPDSALLGEKFSLYIGIGIALILSATIIITLSASQSAFRRGMQKNSA